MEPRDTQHGRTALAFAQALVDGRFHEAQLMLSPLLRERISAEDLESEYSEMIEYGDGPADFVDVMNELKDWPAKRPGDVGWAYAAISGPGYSEAVAVVVADEGGQSLIREIEWGRP